MRISLFCFLVVLTACHPERQKFAEAEQLAMDGKYDEAVTAYNQVGAGWPESPEAKMAANGAKNALLKKADALFQAADYDGAASAYQVLVQKYPETQLTEVPAGLSLVATFLFKGFKDNGASKTKLENPLELWNSETSGPFKNHIGAWMCESREDFSAYKDCSSVDPDITGLELKEAVARFDRATQTCAIVTQLGPICDDEIATELAALAKSDGMSQLSSNIDDATAVWIKQSAQEAAKIARTASSLGRPCVGWNNQVRVLEGRTLDHVMRNQYGAAMRLEPQTSALRLKISKNDDQLSDLSNEVKLNNWPAPLIVSTQQAIKEGRDKC